MPSINSPHLLPSRIRRPVTKGPLVCIFHDICEAGINYHIFDAGLDVHCFARFLTACNRELSSLIECVPLNLGAVIRLSDGVDLAMLEKAARLEVTIELISIS